MTREDFARALLVALGLPETKRRMLLLVGWMQAEGSGAYYNPLATTRKMPGSYDYNDVGVQHYVSDTQGVKATVATLHLLHFAPILRGIEMNLRPRQVGRRIARSRWGTGDVIFAALSWARWNRDEANARTVATP